MCIRDSLLEVLSDFQVTVPEIGTVKAKTIPYVIITSNNTRDLSDALKRRCLHLFIDYPDEPRELEIVRLKVPSLREALAAQVVAVIRRLRALDLRKAPSISETLDWARALVLLDADALTPALLEETLHLLVKYERDTQRVNEQLNWIAEPIQASAPPQDPTSVSYTHLPRSERRQAAGDDAGRARGFRRALSGCHCRQTGACLSLIHI